MMRPLAVLPVANDFFEAKFMGEIKLTVQTADQTRRAEITVPEGSNAADVLSAAVDNWALPAETEYALANVSKGAALAPQSSLDKSVVSEGDVLEVQPVLVAGVAR